MSKQETNAPVHRINMFPVSASIWSNDTNDGKTFYTVSFQRAYKNGADGWSYSTNFSGSDLLVLARAAGRAYDHINHLRSAAKEVESEQPPQSKSTKRR